MKTVRLPITIAAVAGIALLAGCGSGVSGTYTDSHGLIAMTFHGGTVTVGGGMESALGAIAGSNATSPKLKYKVKGKKVIITAPNASNSPLVLEIADDGCLTGIPYGELCKKKS